jgi:hypothetical protein
MPATHDDATRRKALALYAKHGSGRRVHAILASEMKDAPSQATVSRWVKGAAATKSTVTPPAATEPAPAPLPIEAAPFTFQAADFEIAPPPAVAGFEPTGIDPPNSRPAEPVTHSKPMALNGQVTAAPVRWTADNVPDFRPVVNTIQRRVAKRLEKNGAEPVSKEEMDEIADAFQEVVKAYPELFQHMGPVVTFGVLVAATYGDRLAVASSKAKARRKAQASAKLADNEAPRTTIPTETVPATAPRYPSF